MQTHSWLGTIGLEATPQAEATQEVVDTRAAEATKEAVGADAEAVAGAIKEIDPLMAPPGQRRSQLAGTRGMKLFVCWMLSVSR
jgi:hypothetical protein